MDRELRDYMFCSMIDQMRLEAAAGKIKERLGP
jgi:hypothetical protein